MTDEVAKFRTKERPQKPKPVTPEVLCKIKIFRSPNKNLQYQSNKILS